MNNIEKTVAILSMTFILAVCAIGSSFAETAGESEVTAAPSPTDGLYEDMREDQKTINEQSQEYIKELGNGVLSLPDGFENLSPTFLSIYTNCRKAFIPVMMISICIAVIMYLSATKNKKIRQFAVAVFGIVVPVIYTMLLVGLPFFWSFTK